MINFYKYALIIIYEDGEIEKVPIEDFVNHLEYFKKLKEENSHFCTICSNCNFEDYSCSSIKRALNENKAVVIFNFNLKDIVMGTFIPIPGLIVSFPNEYGSLIQKEFLLNLINNYPENYLLLSKYIDGKIVEFSKEDIIKEINGKKI